MDKKSSITLLAGICFYIIGFLWISFIGKVSMMIGGGLLGIFLIKLGESLNSKFITLSKIIKSIGIIFIIMVVVIMSFVIISDITH